MNEQHIINGLQDAIISIYCESKIANKGDRQHIDITSAWARAMIFMPHDEIKKWIKRHCDFDTVMNVWQRRTGRNSKRFDTDEFMRLYEEAMRLTLRSL